MSEYTTCKNCGHPIYRYDDRAHWRHFRKKEGAKHGTSKKKCFQCECTNAEPVEVF